MHVFLVNLLLTLLTYCLTYCLSYRRARAPWQLKLRQGQGWYQAQTDAEDGLEDNGRIIV